jgi:hypothetical protein
MKNLCIEALKTKKSKNEAQIEAFFDGKLRRRKRKVTKTTI